MKIQINNGDHEQAIHLPTRMLLNKTVLRMAFKNRSTNLNGISSAAAEAVLAELQKVKERYGSWTLVEVESADGEQVKITL